MSYEQTKVMFGGWHTRVSWDPQACEYQVSVFHPKTEQIIIERISDSASAHDLVDAIDKACAVAASTVIALDAQRSAPHL